MLCLEMQMKFLKPFFASIFVVFVAMTVNAQNNSDTMAKPKNSPKTEKASEVSSDLENRIYLELKDGRVVIDLMPETAPKHVARIKELARAKFYDGVVFHRVIDGFMAQTGDPTGTGMGGSDKPNLTAEFSSIPHDRGMLSMARAGDPNSANSQFFIVLKDSHFLDGKYTVFGKVSQGMEFVDKIKKGDSQKNGTVNSPDKILTMRVAADEK
jgi:peptidylprolyl isomerase